MTSQGSEACPSQPTWDDCNQLLHILFTTEEKDRILLETWKNIIGSDNGPAFIARVESSPGSPKGSVDPTKSSL
ncbi:Apoptotic protease-activating factor 1 [Manis javanica]|nr:Apoptotic protease-activating factor 1 [Manis javanica]